MPKPAGDGHDLIIASLARFLCQPAWTGVICGFVRGACASACVCVCADQLICAHVRASVCADAGVRVWRGVCIWTASRV